jgi:hypothetical protein
MSPRASPIKSLPEGYREVYYLSVTDMVALVWLNLLSLVLLAAFAILMIAWIAGVRHLRDPYAASTQIPGLFLWIGVILVLPFHEWIHGLAIHGVGHKPIYGIKWADFGRVKLPLVLYTTAGDVFFRRPEFIFVALAPVVVITALGMVIVAVLPDYLAYYVALAVVINGAGAVGDFWMVVVTLRYPADCLVRDEADSIRIYVRDDTTATPSQRDDL